MTEERIDMKQRIHDVMQTPDGAIHIIIDDKNSGLLRLTLAARYERPDTKSYSTAIYFDALGATLKDITEKPLQLTLTKWSAKRRNF